MGQPVQPGSSDILGGVAITSCRVRAVGDYIVAGNVRTLIERWNGTAWTLVPSPSPASSYNILSGVTAASASDAWAVGQSSGNPAGHVFQTLAEHWNGTAWTQATTPNPGTGNNYLASVAATSASGAWAVGGYDTGPGTALHALAVHWNGTAWTQAPIPNPGAGTPTYNYLNAVAATSASDAWAVGSYSASTGGSLTLIDHWNGTAWTHVPSPAPASPTPVRRGGPLRHRRLGGGQLLHRRRRPAHPGRALGRDRVDAGAHRQPQPSRGAWRGRGHLRHQRLGDGLLHPECSPVREIDPRLPLGRHRVAPGTQPQSQPVNRELHGRGGGDARCRSRAVGFYFLGSQDQTTRTFAFHCC